VEQRVATARLADDTEVAYALSGHGPFLVYVPGWLTRLELGWALPAERSFFETLARGRTLLRYDKPGTGLSGPLHRPYSMELELAALDAVTAAAGAGRFDLFGTSLGAAVAAYRSTPPAATEHATSVNTRPRSCTGKKPGLVNTRDRPPVRSASIRSPTTPTMPTTPLPSAVTRKSFDHPVSSHTSRVPPRSGSWSISQSPFSLTQQALSSIRPHETVTRSHPGECPGFDVPVVEGT